MSHESCLVQQCNSIDMGGEYDGEPQKKKTMMNELL